MRAPHAAHFAGTSRFEIIRTLGRGGMGHVYEAHDREQGTRVALKVLEHCDARLILRFKQEFRALSGLEHRNLVSLGELFEDDGLWFFTMELIDGVDFAQAVRPESLAPGFDEPTLRDSLRQLAEGLAFFHAAGKVHRDVKPPNVLVDADGRVVLLDFGLITDLASEMPSLANGPVGTPRYMAPEQSVGRQVGPAADWYSVGVMLYEALTGVPPFTGTAVEIMLDKQTRVVPPPHEVAPEAPRDLSELCARLMAIDPDERPSTHTVLTSLGGRVEPGRADITLVTRAPAFVGRDEDLVRLEERVTAAFAASGPAMIVVEGDSGLGKTTLLEQLVARLRLRDERMLVLGGRCYDQESLNYRALDPIVDALVRTMASLPSAEIKELIPPNVRLLARMFPVFDGIELFACAPAPRRSIPEHEVRHDAFRAMRGLLARLAVQRRVVISIDDMQWADRDSLLLLGELVRGPGAPAVSFLLATRPTGTDHLLADAWQRLHATAQHGVDFVRLEPLGPAAATELATTLLAAEGAADPASAAAIAREAGGHPMHIAELARHAARDRAKPGAVRLDDAIARRVARLPEAARRLACLIAVAGAPLRMVACRRAVAVSPGEFDRALTTLRLEGIARRGGDSSRELLEPYHDRVREALVASMSQEQRRELHDRLVAAMLATAEPAESLVVHLEGAGRLAAAAEHALAAAPRAAASLAYDRAAHLYRTALRLGSFDDDEARTVRLALGEVLAAAGRGRDAAEVFIEAAVGADRAIRLECQRQAAEQLLITGYIDQGLASIEMLLAEVDTALPATPRRAMLSLLRNRAMLSLRGLRWKPRRESELAPEQLIRLDVYRTVSHGLSMVDTVCGADFNARYLRLALATGEPVRLCRALGIEAVFTGSQGGRGARRARQLYRTIAGLADREGNAYARAYAEGVGGVLSFFEGAFLNGAAQLRASEDLFREVRIVEGFELNNVRMFRGFCLTESGAFGELGTLLERWLPEAEQRGDRYLETGLRLSCAMRWLARGDVAGVRDNAERAAWKPPDDRFHLQHWWQVVGRAQLALLQGRQREIVDEVDRGVAQARAALLTRVQIVRCLAVWTQARVHLAAAETDDELRAADRLARRAAARLRRESAAYARVYASLLDATRAERRGDTDRAVASLRAVLAAATDDIGMYVAVASHRLAALVGGTEAEALDAAADAWCHRVGLDDIGPAAAIFAPTRAP